MDTGSRRENSKAVRDEFLVHKVVNWGAKWSVWSQRNVGFPYVKLMILCFHEKLDDEVLVGSPLTSQEGLLGPRMHSAA